MRNPRRVWPRGHFKTPTIRATSAMNQPTQKEANQIARMTLLQRQLSYRERVASSGEMPMSHTLRRGLGQIGTRRGAESKIAAMRGICFSVRNFRDVMFPRLWLGEIMTDEELFAQSGSLPTMYFDGFGAFRKINGVLRCTGYVLQGGGQLNLIVSLAGADLAQAETKRVLEEPSPGLQIWKGDALAH